MKTFTPSPGALPSLSPPCPAGQAIAMGDPPIPKGNVLRRIKQRERTCVYNVLRSIYEDSLLVDEFRQLLRPGVPVLANLRCGAWYSKEFDGECYFKSTDGHDHQWSFSLTRLNAHVARAAAEAGAALLVDSTKTKRAPDSFSATVPIWCSVINRAVAKVVGATASDEWDTALHLPNWILEVARSAIEPLLSKWALRLVETQAPFLADLASALKRPLRPLWISEETLVWSETLPDAKDGELDFTPVYLLSCSKLGKCPRSLTWERFSQFSWTYIRGAADDHESWANGLSPPVFWTHHEDLLSTHPDEIEDKIATLVRSHDAEVLGLDPTGAGRKKKLSQKIVSCSAGQRRVSWLSDLGLGICSLQALGNLEDIARDLEREGSALLIVNLSSARLAGDKLGGKLTRVKDIPVVPHKFNRFSLQERLPEALSSILAALKDGSGRVVLICEDGQDTSPSVAAAFLLVHLKGGTLGQGTGRESIQYLPPRSGGRIGPQWTKEKVRSAVSRVTQFCPKAHPSRGSIKQVYNYLRALYE